MSFCIDAWVDRMRRSVTDVLDEWPSFDTLIIEDRTRLIDRLILLLTT